MKLEKVIIGQGEITLRLVLGRGCIQCGEEFTLGNPYFYCAQGSLHLDCVSPWLEEIAQEYYPDDSAQGC